MDSKVNVIEDSLEHMPEQLVQRNPATLFDESKMNQVFGENGKEFAESYAKNFKILR